MSYCRFSSDNWKCDLYCYQSNEGYVTHVATNRAVGVPEIDRQLWENKKIDELTKAYRDQSDYLGTCERVPIGLDHDGKTFTNDNLRDFLDTLKMLRRTGYNLPDRVIEEVTEEIEDED